MTGSGSPNPDSCIAPRDKFRVIIWRGAERHFLVDQDFPDRKAAEARADELYQHPEVFNASVFSSIGRCIYSAARGGPPADFTRGVTSVTRLAGLDAAGPKRGTYKRK